MISPTCRTSLLAIFTIPFLATLALADITVAAIAVLTGPFGVSGTVSFFQPDSSSPVKITGIIQGLTPNAKRGFQIDRYGDLSGSCNTTGPHFNPYGHDHGAPTDADRHVGDLGNVQSDENGVVHLNFSDSVISLSGNNSIVGRSLVVDSGTDDLGRGNSPFSLVTGNSGAAVACGVVGFAPIPLPGIGP